jgi:hypothetical protein
MSERNRGRSQKLAIAKELLIIAGGVIGEVMQDRLLKVILTGLLAALSQAIPSSDPAVLPSPARQPHPQAQRRSGH